MTEESAWDKRRWRRLAREIDYTRVAKADPPVPGVHKPDLTRIRERRDWVRDDIEWLSGSRAGKAKQIPHPRPQKTGLGSG